MTNSFDSQSTTPELGVKQIKLPQRLPIWRLLVPLLFQTGLILASPAQPFYTQITGKTVILQTVPVDPYDFLRGYSQTLNYDISAQSTLKNLPGWKELVKQSVNSQSSDSLAVGTKFYLILQAPASSKSSPPPAWKPVGVSGDRPTNLPPNQIALKGYTDYNQIKYGVETYYIPEERISQINQDISRARWGRQQQSVVVEVKVDAQGRAVPISFWIDKENYRY